MFTFCLFHLEGSGDVGTVSKGAKGGRKGSSAVTGRDGGGAAKDPDESYSYDDEEDDDVIISIYLFESIRF